MLKARPTSAFETLNPSQRRAATHGTVGKDGGVAAGPLLLVAGAGTGKTWTLAHRIAHLILGGVDPARILILAFTQRAARDLVRQAQLIVSKELTESGRLDDRQVQSRLLWSGSFESVGNRILRQFAGHVGLDPRFTVLGRADSANFMGAIRHESGLSDREKRFPARDVCLWIYSQRVHSRLSLQQTLAEYFPRLSGWEADLAQLYRKYVARKQKYNVLDGEDLLLYWHAMMQTPALARNLSGNFDHALVDEYQELSVLQDEILQSLKPDGQGLTVTGDDAQAIHPLRSRRGESLAGFANRYTPKAETVVMAQNARSTQPILDCANALNAEGPRQFRKTVFGTRPASQKPLHVTMDDEAGQVEYLVGRFLAVRELGGRLKRHAVLFRRSRDSAALQLELRRRGVPFVVLGGHQFLEAEHIKDVLSVLRWVENPRNIVAGFRALKLVPGFGAAEAKAVLRHVEAQGFDVGTLAGFDAGSAAAKDWKLFAALVAKLADPGSGWIGQVGLVRDWYKPQLERLHDSAFSRARDVEQLDRLSVLAPGRERFLTEFTLEPPALISDQASLASSDEDYVTLATIGSAKGLEWDCVYVMNVCEGNLPSDVSGGNTEQTEEERRQLYVAMNRARGELHLCSPLKLAARKPAEGAAAPAHGGRSRFMTDSVLEACERVSFRSPGGADTLGAGEADTVDVATQIKEMW